MNGDVGMHYAKNSGNKKFLSNTIKDTSTIMHNPLPEYMQGGVTHDCASILDSIAKGTSCFHYFSHSASLHRLIFGYLRACAR